MSTRLSSEEKKDLAAAESEAQRIRLMMAGEIEIRERQAAAKGALENLALDLKGCREQLLALAYSPDEHEMAKTILAEPGREAGIGEEGSL